MNKQQKTYILSAAVILVWGLIGYRIYKGLYSNNNVSTDLNFKEKFVPSKIKTSQNYVVSADYRDPFLGEFNNLKKKKQKINTPKITNEALPFPEVIYNGLVKAGHSKSYTLTINGRQELMKVGDMIEEVRLVKATENNVIVRFQKITKTIKLQ